MVTPPASDANIPQLTSSLLLLRPQDKPHLSVLYLLHLPCICITSGESPPASDRIHPSPVSTHPLLWHPVTEYTTSWERPRPSYDCIVPSVASRVGMPPVFYTQRAPNRRPFLRHFFSGRGSFTLSIMSEPVAQPI